MEIEKLIDQLRTESLYKDKATLEIMDLCMEAALAIEQLQAENDRHRRERDDAVKDIWVPRWKSCKFGPGCDYISAVTGFPDCAGCGEWTWRGLKEE